MRNLDFGITIPCYRGDLDLLVGLLESLKDFYPEIPICLIPDGYINVSFFKKKYGCLFIDPSMVHPELLFKSYGYGLTKMVAFWHSPFERFLHIDADAVCWGDFFQANWLHEADLVVNSSHEVVTDDLLREQYFDVSKLPPTWVGLDPNRDSLFNSGTFGSRRGLFDLREYINILDFMRKNQGSIFQDQGILNILSIRYKNNIRFLQKDLQVVVPVVSRQELESRFVVSEDGPIVNSGDKRLLHWAGAKPRRASTVVSDFTLPMDYYRLKHFGLYKGARSPFGRFIADYSGSLLRIRAKIGNRLFNGSRV